MTKKEMQIKLGELAMYARQKGWDDEYTEAVNMAIKALEQEPCGDAISRQAVLELQYRIDDSATLSVRDVVNVEDIEDLPPVTPQPKMGQWIVEAGDRETGYGGCTMCSECAGEGNTEMDYCPNCGAKMTESEDEE